MTPGVAGESHTQTDLHTTYSHLVPQTKGCFILDFEVDLFNSKAVLYFSRWYCNKQLSSGGETAEE